MELLFFEASGIFLYSFCALCVIFASSAFKIDPEFKEFRQ